MQVMENSTSILDGYDTEIEANRGFTAKLQSLLVELLSQEKIAPHSVACRLKSRDSLKRKIARPEKNYRTLSDVTDLCGVRVITYLKSDIERVAAVIEREFKVDGRRSIDRRAFAEPDRFGYASMHYVVSFKNDRLRLREYAAYKGRVAEIQVRSIIMHAWAEIEHDLGYKSEVAIPKNYRRRFSRLSALLELADDEFQSLSESFTSYRATLSEDFKAGVPKGPVNGDSLLAFVQNYKPLAALEREIALSSKSKIVPAREPISDIATSLQFLGVKTFEELITAFERHKSAVRKWGSEWLGDDDADRDVVEGISLFYLCYCLAAEDGGLERLTEYCEFANIVAADGFKNAVPVEAMAAYKKFGG